MLSLCQQLGRIDAAIAPFKRFQEVVESSRKIRDESRSGSVDNQGQAGRDSYSLYHYHAVGGLIPMVYSTSCVLS